MSKQRQANLGWLNEQLARNRESDTSNSIFPVSQATTLKDQPRSQQIVRYDIRKYRNGSPTSVDGNN